MVHQQRAIINTKRCTLFTAVRCPQDTELRRGAGCTHAINDLLAKPN